MIIYKNQVQRRYVDEWNCIRDHKDARKRNRSTCSRSSQMNKTVRILSCKILWCWISDAWAADFLNEIRQSRPFLLINCSMNNDMQCNFSLQTELKRRETLNTIL